MKSKRRAWVIVGLLAVAIVGLGVWAWVNEGPLYWWVMTERTYIELPSGSSHTDLSERGWIQLSRWSSNPHGPFASWYRKTGYRAREGFVRLRGESKLTSWNVDGTVNRQAFSSPGELGEGRNSPPWLWGVTDQTSPSMPEWMKDDAKWAKALEEQGQ